MSDPNITEPERLARPGDQDYDPKKVRTWLDKRVAYTAPLRRLDTLRWRKAELYDQHTQAIKLAYTAADSSMPGTWTADPFNPDDPMSLPKPVINFGTGPRINESARLGRPEYIPTVRPSGTQPDIRARQGSKKGERYLKSRMKEMGWSVQEDRMTYHMPLYGGAWWKSEWITDWSETVRCPVTTAYACAKHPAVMGQVQTAKEGQPDAMGQPAPEPCDFTLAERKVPGQYAAQMGVEQAEGQEGQDVSVGYCPQCEDHPPLLPMKPSMEEAKSGKDSIGRPLGKTLPKGDWCAEVVSPYDVFLRNSGVDVRDVMDELVYVHTETLDWLANRYPKKIRDADGNLLVKPENPAKLMEYHPIAGMPDIYGQGANAGMFEESLRVKECHKKPWMEWNQETKEYALNKGRSIVMAGDVVMMDGDFLVQSQTKPGQTVPRVLFKYIPHDLRDGGRRVYGMGMWEGMWDAQDGANQRTGQAWAVNQRGALPFYLENAGVELDTAEADSEIPFRRIRAQTDALSPDKPALELLNNTTIDAGVWQEIQFYQSYIASQETDVEGGKAPGNISAAQGIKYLKEESGEKRRPRIRRIREALKEIWQHGMELCQALAVEPREYTYQDDDEQERDDMFQALDLQCDPVVEIEPTPDYDVEDIRIEQARDAISLGLADINDPKMRKVMFKVVAPLVEAFVTEDKQEEQAEREYYYFMRNDRVPVVDPSLDAGQVHYDNHGLCAMSEEFRDLEDRSDWDGALAVIGATWEQDVRRLAFEPPPLGPPGSPPPPFPIPPAMVQQLVASGQMPPPPPPKALQVKLFEHWLQTLGQAGFKPKDEKALRKVLYWRAHMEHHKMQDEIKQAQANAGMPTLAAPGADATQAGTQPTTAAPPTSGPMGMPAQGSLPS